MIETCEFRTERLVVAPWHSATLQDGRELPDLVIEMLTPAVTEMLPPDWHGEYTDERASAWIAERDGEGTTLLAVELATAEPLGLVILGEELAREGLQHVDLRLGYLLAESAWRRGFAGEMVGGLVEWCRSHPQIRSIFGGIDAANAKSARVLTKNGFEPVSAPEESGEQIYELRLAAR